MQESNLHYEELFWNKVSPSGDCWIWTGVKSEFGHGKWKMYGYNVMAHRASWMYLVGPLPSGVVLDHLCRNPSCVNPDHLQPVSNAENIKRGFGPTARNQRKSHCKRGHEFTAENTYRRPNAPKHWRQCLACKREFGNRIRDEEARLNPKKRGRPKGAVNANP